MESKKRKERARVLSQKMIAPDIYDMRIAIDPELKAAAGQFVGIYPKDKSTLLPRPISICEADEGILRLVYRVQGKGTREFSTYQEGEDLEILAVLGNGFPTENEKGKKVVLMGGGIGIPPLVELAKCLGKAGAIVTAVMGYRDGHLFLKEDLERYADVFIATEDGSVGIKGNVLTVMEREQIQADVIMACGPMAMLRGIKEYAAQKEIKAYISLEERMACGVGACLGCVCKTKDKDAHSHVNSARICTDGPVFDAKEVDI